MTPKTNGCICDTCADRGVECRNVCDTEWDEQCAACLDGHHTVNELGHKMRRFASQANDPLYTNPTVASQAASG